MSTSSNVRERNQFFSIRPITITMSLNNSSSLNNYIKSIMLMFNELFLLRLYIFEYLRYITQDLTAEYYSLTNTLLT